MTVIPIGQKTLEELSNEINEGHRSVCDGMFVTLRKAIHVGELLLEAQNRVPPGQWLEWIKNNIDGSPGTLRQYMRLATYSDLLPDHIANGQVVIGKAGKPKPAGINAAISYLQTLPDTHRTSSRRRTFDYDTVRHLHKNGVPTRELADMFSVSDGAIRSALLPTSERSRRGNRRKKEYAARQKALNRERAATAIRQSSGDITEAYSLLRKCLQRTQTIYERPGHSYHTKRHLSGVIDRLHQAEDMLSLAIKEPQEETT